MQGPKPVLWRPTGQHPVIIFSLLFFWFQLLPAKCCMHDVHKHTNSVSWPKKTHEHHRMDGLENAVLHNAAYDKDETLPGRGAGAQTMNLSRFHRKQNSFTYNRGEISFSFDITPPKFSISPNLAGKENGGGGKGGVCPKFNK